MRYRLSLGFRPPRNGEMPPSVRNVIGEPELLTSIKDEARRTRLSASFRAAKFAAPDDAPSNAVDSVVAVRVRAISAILVPGYFVDLTDHSVLRTAAPLLSRAPVFSNHCAMPTMWLGHCADAEWDEATTGIDSAPGINCTALIDPRTSPDARTVACGVMAQSLTRWSLGFDLDAEPSHPELELCEFWQRLGSLDSNGQVHRWIAKSVPDIFELSIVDVGAVPSARSIDPPETRATRSAAAVSRFRSRGPTRRGITTGDKS